MLSKENVNNYETPSNKRNLNPINNSMKNQKHLQIFCKDLSKINIQDECGWTPLYRTVVAGDIFATTLLLNNGADPNVQCSMGETPLYQAVDMEKIEHVKLLLKNGADPNISNDDGFTPLHVAVNKQNISIVKILLKFGANPNLKSKLYKQTPLHLAIKNNTDPMILLLLVQFNGSLTNEDKFRKKPIDYTNSKEMQSTIEKLKFGQENPKIEKENEVQNFQTPERKYGWTASNVYTNTIRSQSHSKNLVVEGSNAILQNPGNVILNVINGKNKVSNAKNNSKNNNNDNTIETVKKGLFNTNEEISANSNDNIDNSKTIEDKNEKNDNSDNNEKIDNIDIKKEEVEENVTNKKIDDLNKNSKKIDLNEDKENINPNNNINMSLLLKKTKTGKFTTIQEENSSNESRKNNDSLKPNIIRRSLTTEKSKVEDKETYHKKNFSFSTNTFNNNKNKEYSTSSKKVEEEKNENSSHHEYKKTININKNKDNINININFNKDDLSGSKKKASTNESYYSNTKKKILIKSYHNKEGKKENNINSSYSTKESEKDKDMSKYLYEKIIKKSITKIEIYDDYDNQNKSQSQNNQKKSQKIKTETTEKNIKSNSSNKSLYNKPILKNKFNIKKSGKKVYVRPSVELDLNNSSGCIEKKILRRKTFSRNNVKVNHQKQMTTNQIYTNANIEVNKNPKIKTEKTYTMSRTSLTTLGASKNEQNYNKNSLWKFLKANANEKNDRIFNQSITSNNMNTELDNIYEENYRYPIYDWLKEINLHCYYNLFTQKNIFSMDKVIHNLKTGKFNINKSDIEKIGIIIPGHIYRIITKLEIDSYKIKENISNYLIKNKKRMSGRDINIINNSIYFCCGCSGSNEQIHSCTLNKKIFNLDQWLNKIKMIKYKEKFVENGFDYFEYFILQMFSTIPVDDYILREELKIENDKDRDIILLKLNIDVKYIFQKADNPKNENINIYYKGKQCNIEEYEFDSKQKEKDIDCILI